MSEKKDQKNPLDNMCNMPHTINKLETSILKTEEFDSWLSRLPPKTRATVLARLDMISVGHFGDHKRFEGLLEFRWRNGTRVYGFFWRSSIVIALFGGNKNGQNRDIKKAKKIRDEVLNGTRTVLKP